MRERRSVREFSDKQKKKTKKTLDTAGVVRDSALCRRTWKPTSQQANLSLAAILDLDQLRECTR
jgi:hypothetical protein